VNCLCFLEKKKKEKGKFALLERTDGQVPEANLVGAMV